MWIPDEVYRTVKKSLPLVCVDLIVFNPAGELLLLKRRNEPASGEWWFPGGRVFHGEPREAAAVRKLGEECGIKTSLKCSEWKTLDVFLTDREENYTSHGVSTFFIFQVPNTGLNLDSQSTEAAWRMPADWVGVVSNPLMKGILEELKNER